MPHLSLVIPAFNEEDRLGTTLSKITEYLPGLSIDYEVIVVDDGSGDKTYEIAKDFGKKVKALTLGRNCGKGAAVRNGVLQALGDFVFFSDADLSTPISELPKLLNSLQNGSDVAIGSRAVDYSMIREHQPFYREWMGKTFNKIVQLVVLKGIKDTQCGFKGFSSQAAKRIFTNAKIDGFGFDVEILYLARKFKLSISEIPVEWYNDSRSKVSPVKDSLKMLTEIFRIKKIHEN